MSNQTTEKDRRGYISTLFDPKTFPILIPILIAVGSAFITLDRTVHGVVVTQASYAAAIDKIDVRMNVFQRTHASILVLEARLDRVVADATEQKRLQSELRSIVSDLKHMADTDKNQMVDIDRRLRLLERQIDKLVK